MWVHGPADGAFTPGASATPAGGGAVTRPAGTPLPACPARSASGRPRGSFPVLPPAAPVTLVGVSDVTQILSAIDRGDPRAAAELLPLVYDELRKLAAARLAREAPG